MSCWLLINNIILLAALLSGKVGPGQAIDWPAAAPATVCWHNYAAWCGSFNYIHAGLCAYVCACPGSETRMLKSKMWRQRFLAYFYICESNTALTVFSEKKSIWSHPAVLLIVLVCVFFFKHICELDLRDPCWCHLYTQDAPCPICFEGMATWHIFAESPLLV